jgi:hypothetical protein
MVPDRDPQSSALSINPLIHCKPIQPNSVFTHSSTFVPDRQTFSPTLQASCARTHLCSPRNALVTRSHLCLIHEQFLGVLTVWRKPGNSDNKRIQTYIWGKSVETWFSYITCAHLVDRCTVTHTVVWHVMDGRIDGVSLLHEL